MDVDSSDPPRTPSKRKPTSSDLTDPPQRRTHKRQRTLDSGDLTDRLSDRFTNQHITSPEQSLKSQQEDKLSEPEACVSEPMDIESQDVADNHSQPAEDLEQLLHQNHRTPILAPQDAVDDDLFSDSELDDEEEEDPAQEKRKAVRRYKSDFFAAMCDLDYYNSMPESELRREAIRWMEEKYRNDPKGTVVYPPPWYIGTRFDPPRPKVWIKDFFTGKIRPRQLVNDRLAEMTAAQREEWARKHGKGVDNEEEEDMDMEAE